MSSVAVYSKRSEIPEKYRWDLTQIFKDDEAACTALDKLSSFAESYADWQKKAFTSAEALCSYLRFDDEVSDLFERVSNYIERKADEDLRIGSYQTLKARLQESAANLQAAAAWFEPALLEIEQETLESWYVAYPDLLLYKRALERIRLLRPHVLTPPEEELLAQAGILAAQPEIGYSQLVNADLCFESAVDSKGVAHPLTHGSFVPLQMNQDRALREDAYHKLYKGYKSVEHTCAALLAAQLRQLSFFARSRHYTSTLEASLAPTEIPESVYNTLVDTVSTHTTAMHEYMKLRARALGLDHIHYWDVYVPIVEMPEHHYSFEEACELMLKALAPLGKDYIEVVQKAIDERWYDVYETPGKASGAYSAGGGSVTPVILLNFQGTLDDVFTLVHETGHSLHTYLSSKHQPGRYHSYEMFEAEIASTTNECLLMHYLLEQAKDNKERAYLLDHFCESFKGTLFRQTLFAEFERDINKAAAKGEDLSAGALSCRYRSLCDTYYGSALISDDEIAREWARIPHFYYDFYVYVYATSFAAANAFSQRILQEGEPAQKRYLDFLSSGCSKAPLELLEKAGLDMSGEQPIVDALAYFERLVDELKELL